MNSLMYAAAAAAKQGFNPLSFDNGSTKRLRAWWDPRDPSRRTVSSGRVTALSNIVTGVNIVEDTGTGPLFDTTLNGGPCLVGDNTRYLVGNEADILAAWSGSSGLAPHTIIALVEEGEPTGAACVFGVGRGDELFNQSSALEFNSIGDDADTYTYARTPNSVTVQWYGGTPPSAPVAVGLTWDGTTPLLRTDGSSVSLSLTGISGTPPGAVASPTRYALLARGRQNFAGKFNGKVGPVLIYAGALSSGEVDAATAGLRRWYGLPV